MTHPIKKFLFSFVVPTIFAVAAVAPADANAQRLCVAGDVCAGYDLFQTTAGTAFQGIAFNGLPLGTFDFGPSGGPPGAQGVGSTDTIVQRLDTVLPPGGTTRIEMLALQLISVNTYDVNLNPDPGGKHLYVTLNDSVRSLGSMTIDIVNPLAATGNGTFDSTLDVVFDLTWGSPNGVNLDNLVGCGPGPCVLTLSSNDVPWDRTPPPGAFLIPGVNHLLDGSDIFGDFWPNPFIEEHPCCGQHSVTVATPEPGTLAVLGAALFGFWGLRRRLSRRV